MSDKPAAAFQQQGNPSLYESAPPIATSRTPAIISIIIATAILGFIAFGLVKLRSSSGVPSQVSALTSPNPSPAPAALPTSPSPPPAAATPSCARTPKQRRTGRQGGVQGHRRRGLPAAGWGASNCKKATSGSQAKRHHGRAYWRGRLDKRQDGKGR